MAKEYDPPPLSGVAKPTKYFYNLDRQVDSIVRPDSIAIKFRYDAAGRPDTVHFDRGYLRFGYSATTGNLTSIRAPGNDSLKFSYDGSLPTQVTWAGSMAGSVRVKYNTDFRVDSQYVNGASGIKFSYDNDGLLTHAGGLKLGRSSTNGLLTADTLGPVRTAYSYSSRGELKGYQVKRSSTVLFGVGYIRDSLGRITQLFDTTQGTPTRWSYVYDGVGRLVTDSVNGVLSHGFTYDSNGNRLTYSVNGGGVTSYVYDDQDRLTFSTGPGGTTTYTYTSNGELTRKIAGSDTTRYSYDVLGSLVKVILPSHDSIEYLIDGQNRRVGRKFNGAVTNRWLYQNQLNPVAELDSAGNLVSRFVYGSGLNVPDYMLKGGAVYRLITDHLGSVRLVVDTVTGLVAQWAKYDEWGVVTADSGAGFQPFGFAGGILDESTGLLLFGARDYEATVGRWVSRDPIFFAGGSPNLYAYVLNDPVNFVDPDGLCMIAVRYRRIRFLGKELLPGYHAYILLTDPDGSQFFFRGDQGGPIDRCPAKAPYYTSAGSIEVQTGAYGPNTPDYDPGNPSLIPTDVIMPMNGLLCKPFQDRLIAVAKGINAQRIPYRVRGPNSNSVASTGVAALGAYVGHPNQGAWGGRKTPGWGMPLPW